MLINILKQFVSPIKTNFFHLYGASLRFSPFVVLFKMSHSLVSEILFVVNAMDTIAHTTPSRATNLPSNQPGFVSKMSDHRSYQFSALLYAIITSPINHATFIPKISLSGVQNKPTVGVMLKSIKSSIIVD